MLALDPCHSTEAPKYTEQVTLLTRRFQRAKLDTFRKKKVIKLNTFEVYFCSGK